MSANGSRLKRVPLARTGPIRNRLVPGPQPVPQANGTDNGTVMGALENGVRTAYAVIDEYLRRGEEAARGLNNESNGRGHMNDYKNDYGNRFNPWGPMGVFAEQWITMMQRWTEAWSAFMPGNWGQPMQQMWGGMAGYAPGYAAAPNISVQVASQRPAEVTANLRPGCDFVALTAEPLKGEGSAASAPALHQVSIGRDPMRVRVSVMVPADQPSGCYRGIIRKSADGTVAGELTVVISEA